MNDETTPPPGEPVGSVGEEAAKLFGALSEWARTQGGQYADAAADAAAHVSHGFEEVGEHLATGSAECQWCPVCRTVHFVRQTSPEVRAHLTQAASSLMQAVAGMLATPAPADRAGGVQRIDLDDAPWDES